MSSTRAATLVLLGLALTLASGCSKNKCKLDTSAKKQAFGKLADMTQGAFECDVEGYSAIDGELDTHKSCEPGSADCVPSMHAIHSKTVPATVASAYKGFLEKNKWTVQQKPVTGNFINGKPFEGFELHSDSADQSLITRVVPFGQDMVETTTVLTSAMAGSGAKVGSSSSSAPAGPLTPLKAYPDSSDGLSQLMGDLFDAVKAKDTAKARQISLSLKLDDPGSWFKHAFGDTVGARLAADYPKVGGQLNGLPEFVKQLESENKTSIGVERFAKKGDPNANTYEDESLKAMKGPGALYSVRITQPGKKTGLHVYSFVYDSGFKFLGPMKHAKSAEDNDKSMDAVCELRNKDRVVFFKTGKLPGDE